MVLLVALVDRLSETTDRTLVGGGCRNSTHKRKTQPNVRSDQRKRVVWALMLFGSVSALGSCKRRTVPGGHNQREASGIKDLVRSPESCKFVRAPLSRPKLNPEQFIRPSSDLGSKIWSGLLALRKRPMQELGNCSDHPGLERVLGDYLAVTLGGPMSGVREDTGNGPKKPNYTVRLACAPLGRSCASMYLCELSGNDLESTGDAHFGLDFIFDNQSNAIVSGSVSCS